MSESSVANLACEAGGASATKSSESTQKNLVVCCDVCGIQCYQLIGGMDPSCL